MTLTTQLKTTVEQRGRTTTRNAVDFDAHSSPFSAFVRNNVRLQLHNSLSHAFVRTNSVTILCAMRRAVKIRTTFAPQCVGMQPFSKSSHLPQKYFLMIYQADHFRLRLDWLRQIRRIRRSLDAESAKTLCAAFITSRIDGCKTVLTRSPRTITDRLQRLPCRR